MGVWPWHDLRAHHLTSCRTGHHATRAGGHGFAVPAHQWRYQDALNHQCALLHRHSPAGTPSPIPRQPRFAWLLTPYADVPGTKLAASACCWAAVSRPGSSRDSSGVTGLASVAQHRWLCIVDLLWWYWSRCDRICQGMCPATLQGPACHTSQDARMLPALCAYGRGVSSCTLRQRPAGRRLRKPGIASFVRASRNSAYLVRLHVLLHPILRQEPHPLSHHQRILSQGFSDRWDGCSDT